MMNIKEIKEILPHRYPMLLIDRVLEMDIEEKMYIKGYKNFHLMKHFSKATIQKNQLCQVFFK